MKQQFGGVLLSAFLAGCCLMGSAALTATAQTFVSAAPTVAQDKGREKPVERQKDERREPPRDERREPPRDGKKKPEGAF